MYYDFALLIIAGALSVDIRVSRKCKMDNPSFVGWHRLKGNRPPSIASLVREPSRKFFKGCPPTFLVAAHVDTQHRPFHLL